MGLLTKNNLTRDKQLTRGVKEFFPLPTKMSVFADFDCIKIGTR